MYTNASDPSEDASSPAPLDQAGGAADESWKLLEALPGPAWIVDCGPLQILQRNTAARALSRDSAFTSLFLGGLDDGLLYRLRSSEPQISFHGQMRDEQSQSLFSASLLPGSAAAKRLILAQPASLFDTPTELTFDELLDSSFDGLVILNSERRIVQISKRFEQMFGYSIEDLRGKSPGVLVPPGCEAEFESSLLLLDRGGEHHLDTRRLRRDGTLLEVRVSSQAIASGRFRGGLVGVYRDLTETNRNTRHRTLQLEATRILARAETIEQAAKELLPAMSEALGWTIVRLWLMGENGLECAHGVYPRDFVCNKNFESPEAECTLSGHVARTGIAVRLADFHSAVACAVRDDCKLRGGSMAVLPIADSQKQILGVLELRSLADHQPETGRRELVEGICTHLGQFITRSRAETALAENEAKFRTLAETSPIAIFIHRDGFMLYANAACETITGYTREEIMNGQVWGLFHEEEQADIKERVRRRLEGEEVKKRWEARMIRKDGEVRWVDYSAARIMMNNHAAVLCAAVDITERRALEVQLRQTQKMEAVGRLAGGIAHDFNNLLMVIGCCSELIRMNEAVPEDVRQGANEISHAADRAAALTRQLLAFSRHQVLAPKIIDLNSVLKGTELILRRTLGDDIVLRFEFDPGVGTILADPSQIEQVAMNLAVNARDAMPNGGELSITTSSSTPDAAHASMQARRYTVLTVADNGIGMSQETQQHIFEPFFTTKHASKGTGLGLSTVYGIVEQSGGYIEVESAPDCGATFRIGFPATEGKVGASGGAKPAEATAKTGTILLVEDEEEVRAVLQSSLVRAGHKVLQASSGAEALMVSASEVKIDLLVTDVVMSEMSGRELADRMVGLRPDLHVLFISGYNEDTVLQKGVVEGQMEFLQKPFTPAVFLKKVRQLLTK